MIEREVSLAPNPSAIEFEYEEPAPYLHDIALGSLSTLQMMPGQPWTIKSPKKDTMLSGLRHARQRLGVDAGLLECQLLWSTWQWQCMGKW